MTIPEGITINYDVNLEGQIQQISNYDLIQRILNYRFEKALKIYPEKEIENSSGYAIIMAMIDGNSEDNIFISDIYHFNRLNGIELNYRYALHPPELNGSFHEKW